MKVFENKNIILDKEKYPGKINLVFYSDKYYEKEKNENIKTAIKLKFFDNIYSFSPEDLDEDFIKKTLPYIKIHFGAGYWIWKPYIIDKVLNNLNYGDYLLYLDSGIILRKNIKDQFIALLDLFKKDTKDAGIIAMQNDNHEYQWTKKEIFDYLNVTKDSEVYNDKQIIANFLFFKKNHNSENVIKKWLDIAVNETELFSDNYKLIQDERLIRTTHDQSVLSLLLKLNKAILISTENKKLKYSIYLFKNYRVTFNGLLIYIKRLILRNLIQNYYYVKLKKIISKLK